MSLPIEPVLPALITALAATRRAVLQAPPGAGKTTHVPLALLDQPWLDGKKIVLLEPRRLAARAAAARMAATLGERIGDTVGYRIRLDTRIGPRTRLEVVTEGILTRMLQDDPSLDGIGLVVFDEFHERSLAADTGLALTLASAQLLRDDLAILVMSATLDGVEVARLLGGAPVIRSEGRAYPVDIRHSAPRPGQWIHAHVASVVRAAVAEETGSILVFLPGAGEIRQVEAHLHAATLPADVDLHPLHGSLAPGVQDAAIAPPAAGRRKIVLATSIAETSLTIEGIRVVIDSGLIRVPRFSPRTGMTRLETVRVSRASAAQRAGRAGRLAPGVCVRCWHAADDSGLVPFSTPEILDADLAPLALDLAAAGFADPAALAWLDSPPAAAFAQGRELLTLLGALDAAGQLTRHGRAMARVGAHPRLAHMLLRASRGGPDALRHAASLAALVEERDILRGDAGPPPADIRLRLDAVERDLDHVQLGGATVDRHGLARVRDLAASWRDKLRLLPTEPARPPHAPPPLDDPGLLLALAYPDRVAQRRDAPGRFLLRNGRGASLPVSDPLAHEAWLVAVDLDDSGRDGGILRAAPLDPAELRAAAAEQVVDTEEVAWDDRTRSVIARRRSMLGALVLGESAIADADPAQLTEALLRGIRRIGLDQLPWTDAAANLRRRLAFLHAADPSWPDVSDHALLATLEQWLGPAVVGLRRIAQFEHVDLGSALLTLLPWPQRADLDTLAPERLEVPSGSRIAIDYGDPAAPVLAVRLQEIFGLTATPRLAGGRVPVTVQLLSPAYRPVQVTRDLESFWRTGYFDVRKDMRGRYPKHHWPDDPLSAPPVRGAKRRR